MDNDIPLPASSGADECAVRCERDGDMTDFLSDAECDEIERLNKRLTKLELIFSSEFKSLENNYYRAIILLILGILISLSC